MDSKQLPAVFAAVALWVGTVLISGFVGYAIKWWTCPNGRHICVGGGYLAPDYSQFWIMFGVAFGLLGLIIVICQILQTKYLHDIRGRS